MELYWLEEHCFTSKWVGPVGVRYARYTYYCNLVQPLSFKKSGAMNTPLCWQQSVLHTSRPGWDGTASEGGVRSLSNKRRVVMTSHNPMRQGEADIRFLKEKERNEGDVA